MEQASDPRIKILISIIIVLILGGIIAIFFVARSESTANTEGNAVIELQTNRFALGDISMAKGIVKKEIAIKNTGTADLKISDLYTSCMCTKISLKVDDKTSPAFGMKGHGGPSSLTWSQIIRPGQSGQLEIAFDPNAHGPTGTGPINRTATLSSNEGGKTNVLTNISFSGNVIK